MSKKRCSVLDIIKQMHWTALRYCVSPLLAKIKCWRSRWQGDTHCSHTLLLVIQNDTNLSWTVGIDLHNYVHLPYHPAIPVLGIYLKAYFHKMKWYKHKIFYWGIISSCKELKTIQIFNNWGPVEYLVVQPHCGVPYSYKKKKKKKRAFCMGKE